MNDGLDREVIISIHAPMKGATKLNAPPIPVTAISIHAPMKGATCQSWWDSPNIHISIHAPMKGATFYLYLFASYK